MNGTTDDDVKADLILHEQGHETPYLRIQPSGSLKEFSSVSIDLSLLYAEIETARKDHGIAVENSNGWRKRAQDLKERNKEMRALLDSFHEVLGRVLFEEIVALHRKRVVQVEDWPSYDPAFDDEKARL